MLITYVDLAKIINVSKSAVSQRKAKGIFKQALVKTEDGKDYLDKDLQLKEDLEAYDIMFNNRELAINKLELKSWR